MLSMHVSASLLLLLVLLQEALPLAEAFAVKTLAPKFSSRGKVVSCGHSAERRLPAKCRLQMSGRVGPIKSQSSGKLHEMRYDELMEKVPKSLTDRGRAITYSRKVFIPLTKLCRDKCSYCTFADHNGPGSSRAYMTRDEVLDVARKGVAAGCTEALFTLGDRPEARWPQAAEELKEMGYESTVAYLAACCEMVLKETGLLPHANPGVLDREEMALLRQSCASQGLMLESLSERLMQPGMPHHGCPDKQPKRRLETLAIAGELRVPYTTGILIGIGETRQERITALEAIRDAHTRFGHIQEVIVQPFRAKADTGMSEAADCTHEELLWTLAAANAILAPVGIPVQTPPNLSDVSLLGSLLDSGASDWGGVSPVTLDFVNPERAWPAVGTLRAATEAAGHRLVARLPSYPKYCTNGVSANSVAPKWHSGPVVGRLMRHMDAEGLARGEEEEVNGWTAGCGGDGSGWGETGRFLPGGQVYEGYAAWREYPEVSDAVRRALEAVEAGKGVSVRQVETLLAARGHDLAAVIRAGDTSRKRANGGKVSYAVVRNINYTNVCYFKCAFCAFSKTRQGPGEAAYDLPMEEISRRVREAWERGATEVCMQGGIHPDYTGETYLKVLRAAKDAEARIHVHAFSPLEVAQGAETLGKEVGIYLGELKEAGLGSLPGTAAEVLDDEVRETLCPDKLRTREWLEVVRAAHRKGLATTSTIMFGHIEGNRAVARHLLRLRNLQRITAGITEFVPLPFVHEESPIFLRLVLSPGIENVQVSWVKMGSKGAAMCLRAGVNDLGGTLMNESISRAAGAKYGQEQAPQAMREIIDSVSIPGDERSAWQRTTLYAKAGEDRVEASFAAKELEQTRYYKDLFRSSHGVGVCR